MVSSFPMAMAVKWTVIFAGIAISRGQSDTPPKDSASRADVISNTDADARFITHASPLVVAFAPSMAETELAAPTRPLAPSVDPTSIDLRPKFAGFGLTPRVQGGRGTCSVFAVTQALEFALARKKGSGERLSEEFLKAEVSLKKALAREQLSRRGSGTGSLG